MDRSNANGGFPLPPAEQPVRLLRAHHDACGGDTRVRLPRVVPSRAVRRVVCDQCAEPYEPARVDDVEPGAPSISSWMPSLPVVRLPSLPSVRLPSPSWRWLSLPAAAAAVIGALLLIQGDDDSTETSGPAAAAPAQGQEAKGGPRGERRNGTAAAPKDAQLISESTFQLALPAGWERTAPSGGATFAAVAPGGDADVMLWIERDPKLDFATFEQRSLAQLESLAGSAETVGRNPGPTAGTTSITIAPTSAPDGAPNYEVVLRASERGDYWYYLATTSQPGADPETIRGVELVQGSFLPQGSKR